MYKVYCYIKDLFEVLLQASNIAEKIRLSLIKRPSFSLTSVLDVLKRRGASPLAISKYKDALEIHQLAPLASDTSSRRDNTHKLINQPTEETIKRVNELQ